MPRTNPIYYNVAPRFTCGSPAQVSFETAYRVMREEVNAYVLRDNASNNLEGIAYATCEKGKFMWVYDLATDAVFRVPLLVWGGAGPHPHWHNNPERNKYLIDKDLMPSELRNVSNDLISYRKSIINK